MALTVSVRFTAGIYSGHHADQVNFPPSPARLISALVAAAHGTPGITDHGRDILQILCEAPDPVLVVPPAYEGGSAESYMQQPLATLAGSNVKAQHISGPQRIMGERGGKVKKRVNGHFIVTGDLYFVWDDLDFDDAQIELLNQLATDVAYLGRESDLVLLHAHRSSVSELMSQHRSTHLFHKPMPSGGKKLRVPSKNFLSWLDDRFHSVFGENAREPIPADHRVRSTAYAPAAVIPGSNEAVLTIPFARPLRLDRALELASKVHPEDGGTVFPLARAGNQYLDGAAIGLGVVTSSGVRLDEDFDTSFLGEDSGAVTLQPNYWTRRAQVWMTAVAYVGHPDKWVAAHQILTAVPDAEILKMSAAPVRPSQQHIKTSPTKRAWHIVLRTPETIPGPLLLDREQGTGVCLPDYQNQEVNS